MYSLGAAIRRRRIESEGPRPQPQNPFAGQSPAAGCPQVSVIPPAESRVIVNVFPLVDPIDTS
jgi:hypothetical protein